MSDISAVNTNVLGPRAARAFDKLETQAQRQVAEAMPTYAIQGVGDVKAMVGTQTMRLQVADFRIIFDEDADKLVVLALGHRRDIYRRGPLMSVQILKTESGAELVAPSRRDYDALLARLGDEEAEDRMTLVLAAEARAEAPLPESVSPAVLRGEGLLRALRVWRGMTQVQLADAAGIGPPGSQGR